MKKERLFYLDFVRAIAVVSIVLTHFNALYMYLSPARPEKAVITLSVCNVYIGDWGVSLFFIISGAALMYVYDEKCDLKLFFKKRFLSIYPMFWIAYTAAFLYEFYFSHSVVGGGMLPKSRIIFSVLGCDGLLYANGIPTFYILGEWFLGVIVLMYLIFPLLRYLLNKNKIVFWILMLGMYVAAIMFCSYGPLKLQMATVIFVRLPEIAFGMYFVKKGFKVNHLMAIVSVVVLVVNQVLKPSILGSIQTTYVGIASFLLLVYISEWFKCRFTKTICSILSKYSYAIFLVHHIIIAKMTATFDLNNITLLHSYLLFLCVCVVIAFFAWILYNFHDRVMKELMHK